MSPSGSVRPLFTTVRGVQTWAARAGVKSSPRIFLRGLANQADRKGKEAKKERTVIVTGAGRGIGKSIALRLARDGFNVCVNDIPANEGAVNDVVSAINALSRNAIPYLCDVSDRDACTDMVEASAKELGPLDVMIANAGIAQVKPLLDLTQQDLERMFQVNVFGVYNCYTAAAKKMIEQGSGGKILGAASIVSFKPFALLSHYSASKFAVRGLTQAFAMEMAPYDITVNAYAPGIVGTAMWELIDEKLAEIHGTPKGSMIKKYTEDLIAMKRTSVPEDVSKVVSFLAGPDSEYVTGQTVVVDGGIVMT